MLTQPKNLKEALFPHFTSYALIGYGIFRSPSGKLRPVLSMIYAGACACIYFTTLYFTVKFMVSQTWFDNYDKILLVVLFVNVGIIIVGVLLSWYSSERFTRIIEDLSKVDETLRDLGATFKYSRTRNEGYGMILMGIIMVIGLNCVDVLWFFDVHRIFEIFLVFSVLHSPAHAGNLVVTNFCMEIRLIGMRYKEANAILEAMKRPCCYDPVSPASDRTRQLLRSAVNHKRFIQIIKQVHLELRGISRNLCKSYGVQLVLNMASLFVMNTGFLYLLYTIARNPMVVGQDLRMLVLGVWVVFYFIHFFLVNQVCENICAEARRTGEIIHCMSREIVDPELASEISQFSLQLIHDPLDINPAELICLGHRFVLHFVGTVTTYLVILIQMGTPKTEKSDYRHP